MRTRGQGGFSLIEVVAAIGVFSIAVLGVTPLIASSMRGALLNRQLTVAKNLTAEAVERTRGLPLFDAAPNRDVLDLYFPNLGTGYDATAGTFTTTCTRTTSVPAPSAALACPPPNSDGTAKLPPGYTMTFTTEFVEVVPGSSPETYSVIKPVTGWSSNAEPPARLVRLRVSTAWILAGRPRSYQLTTLVGDRKLSEERIRGEGRVDFVVEALTSYQQDPLVPPATVLQAIAGRSSSAIELKSFARATQDTSAAKMTLTRQESPTLPGTVISEQSGARSVVTAPPDVSALPVVSGGSFSVLSDLLVPQVAIGGVTTTSVNESTPAATVSVANQLPVASGNFALTGGQGSDRFWVNNQAEIGNSTALKLDGSKKVVSVHRVGNDSSGRLSGYTSATSTALLPTSSRKVETAAHAQLKKIVLLPTTYIGDEGGVVVIEDFVADVSCKSTGSAAGAAVTGTWSATLKYWRDLNANLTDDGSYSPKIALSGSLGSTASDQLAPVKAANPKVYEGALPTSDVYLFDDPSLGRRGYLDSWSTQPSISSSTTDKRSTVQIDFAIQIVTAKTNLTNDKTRLALTLGKLSCSAEDKR
jgi:prepilin-type N-terminal cleavage/methylation domain-containing protein